MSDLPAREFTRAVRDYGRAHELWPSRAGARVVVGVSGGPDSVALLHALHELSRPLGLALIVAHLDHGLRRGSARDAAWVSARARELGRPCVPGRADVRALARRRRFSLEEAGRLARYSFFYRVARARRARLVAVGHPRDDQAETVLLRLLRGAGGGGLAGMSPARALHDPLARRPGPGVTLIRPLLARSRREIESFLAARRLPTRRDPTNRDPDMLRNRIRHELLPLLERRFNPGIRRVLSRAAQVLSEEDAILERAAARVLGARAPARFARSRLVRIPLPIRRRALRLLAVRAGTDARTLGQAHLDALVRLVAAGRGETHLPGVRARCAGGRLMFERTRA